jgi:sortase (surface protein transpeptidase)
MASVLGVRPMPARATADAAWLLPQVVNGAPPSSPSSPSASPSTPPKPGPPTGPPTALRIPSISVTTTLEQLQIATDGTLNTPGFNDAGWYAAGTAPGDIGPAVIAGHIDSATAQSVFYRLGQLTAGALIQVQRDGQWLTFTVTSVGHYPKTSFPAAQVYGPTPTPELRLITCGGTFNQSTRSYDDNLVVYARETG